MTNDLHDKLSDINRSLVTLSLQVRDEAVAGLGSRSKVAEHILLTVLRRVYGAPGLANTNTLASNFPGVDLYDPTSGLAVQVTSETSASKITETIETIVKARLRLNRLVVALVAENTPRYQASTRTRWQTAVQGRFAFDPGADVLAFDRLLPRIQVLPLPDIDAIQAELEALVRGTHTIHLLPHLKHQVEAKLAEERRIARYIPDVFVETHDTKYHARCFAHPALFVRRIAGWFERQPFAGLNRLATMSGVAPISTAPTEALAAADTPEQAVHAAETALTGLGRLDATLATYSEIARAPVTTTELRDRARAYVLEETRYYIEMGAQLLQHEVADRRTELRCVTATLFLLTGPAGQGKTNFLCDFTERFLLRHNIPCAYVTARQLSRIPDPDLAEAVRRLIFPSAVSSLHEGLTTLAAACAEQRRPFVLVIDGLNEHPDVRSFAGQLEHMLETLTRYHHVRVLMTCRSEFLEQRFGALLSGPLKPSLQLSEAHGQRFDNYEHRELVARYFRFFRVRPRRVSRSVTDFLRRDVLLLRFFCEAYGARDRDAAYVQPYVPNIYRYEIFHRYVEDKLGRAWKAVTDDHSAPRPLVRQAQVQRVLSLVAAHMLETGRFADVPRAVVPPEFDVELTALLDEDLVLRNDLGPRASLLDEPAEVLNFTFDEMRDFLLAEHLLSVHRSDPGKFARLLALQPTTAQSVEGLQRFLFYASRVPTNRAFFETYRAHAWYAAVYDTEVFAVPPAHLDAEDQSIVDTALRAGGPRAQHLAWELAVRWDSSHYPVLNLDLLLGVARGADPSFYTGVIAPTFGLGFRGERPIGEDCCRFVKEKLLPGFDPDRDHACDPLFRLLLLLLPVDTTPTLDSPAMAAFCDLVAAHPSYALGLLHEALADGIRWHRAHAWRLLSGATPAIDEPAWFVAAAEADVADDGSDGVLRREAERFLARISAPRRP